MEMIKKVYENGVQVNEIKDQGETAYAELVNVLFNKIDKRYRVKITKDSVNKSIRVLLSFGVNFIGMTSKRYAYELIFTNVSDFIDLR